MNVVLSKTLRKLRENSGLTQQQVADAINVERSTYAYYECGKTTPDIDTVIQLAKIFNVSYVDIFENEAKSQSNVFYDVSGENYMNSNDAQHIYDLSKIEKTLLCYFRVLSDEEKIDVIKGIAKRTEIKKEK